MPTYAVILGQGPSSKALRAADTARLISSTSPSATLAITSPERGSYVGNVFPETKRNCR